ncbi:MAG: hypothetical protein U5L07_15015 [Desulfobacterales bacterium]|nr:hypothetical protein [Desulfobacterales bacterium]
MRHFYLTGAVVLVTMCLFSSGCTLFTNEKLSARDNKPEFELNITNPDSLELPPQLYDQFKAYWKLRYTDEFKAAYAMETPDFRDKVSFEKYRLYIERTSEQQLLELELVRMEQRESDLAEQVIDIEGKFYLKKKTSEKRIQTHLPDRWVRIDGKWFHVARNKLIFPDLGF